MYRSLSSFYLALIIFSPIFSSKIVEIGSWHFLAWTPVGIFTIAIIDTITQQWGKKHSRQTVGSTLVIRAFLYLGIFPILFLLPNAGSFDIQSLLHQSIRNFIVSEGTTFASRFWVEIPVFARLKWPFFWKHTFSNSLFSITKGGSKVFLMFVGTMPMASLFMLMLGDIGAKLGVVLIGAPFSTAFNSITKFVKTRKPEWA